MADPNVTEITSEDYERSRRHGYAGPLSTLHGAHTRDLYERLGADAWQLALENEVTVLRPVKVLDAGKGVAE